MIVMCYYELPEVQREIGYDPAPYIAAVSRRRLESYGPEIRRGRGRGHGAAGAGTSIDHRAAGTVQGRTSPADLSWTAGW